MADETKFYASDSLGTIRDAAGNVSATQLYLGALAVHYRMPACTIRNLRVAARTFTFPGNVTLEIYKNDVATGLLVTFGGIGTFDNLVNAVVFADGDVLDLVGISANDAAGQCAFSATVERF